MQANALLWHIGTLEYLLVKAGLFDAYDVTVPVSPTEKLIKLLRPLNSVPDELLPLLVRMAECAALELGGAVDVGARHTGLVADLRKLNLRHEAIGDLFVAVGKGAALAAEDRRKHPAAIPL